MTNFWKLVDEFDEDHGTYIGMEIAEMRSDLYLYTNLYCKYLDNVEDEGDLVEEQAYRLQCQNVLDKMTGFYHGFAALCDFVDGGDEMRKAIYDEIDTIRHEYYYARMDEKREKVNKVLGYNFFL